MKILMKSRFLAAALAVALMPSVSAAQGLDDPEAIKTIIGSEVEEEQVQASQDEAKVIAAIRKAPETVGIVRKTTTLQKVDIVFLTDAGITEGGPPEAIAKSLEENRTAVDELRKELEGNAMLYHALDSRQILIRDILAVEFNDRNVVIYAAAKPAGG